MIDSKEHFMSSSLGTESTRTSTSPNTSFRSSLPQSHMANMRTNVSSEDIGALLTSRTPLTGRNAKLPLRSVGLLCYNRLGQQRRYFTSKGTNMFLSRFGVKNYKCLGEIDIPLTPIHVLIGPNDAGKTSLMEAIAALYGGLERQPQEFFPQPWQGRELVWFGTKELVIELRGQWLSGLSAEASDTDCPSPSKGSAEYVP